MSQLANGHGLGRGSLVPADAKPDGELIESHSDRKPDAMSSLHRSLSSPPLSRRLAVPAALGLLAVALVHVLDGPGSLSDQLYVGTLELALAAASVPLAVLLLTRPVRLLWHVSGGLCTAALLIYTASRTVGLPGSTDDIGNWFQTLGLLNVGFEAAVIALAALVLWRRPSLRHMRPPAPVGITVSRA